MNTPRQPSLRSITAKNIRKRRKDLSWSQEHLAELAGLHRNHIGHLEREEKAATVDVIEKIAESLGCTPSDLLEEDTQ